MGARRRTPFKLDLTSGPVDLRVVFAKETYAYNEVLPTNVGDEE